MFKISLCQMLVCNNKKKNLEKALEMINKSCTAGANLVVLPEMFNCPYDNNYFSEFAESYPSGETIKFLSKIAKEKSIYLVGGSIPEKDNLGNIYNTCFIFDSNGDLIGQHRKIHLFDIDVKNGIKFKESDVLTPGNSLTIVNTIYGKIGIAICYDIRFPELFRLMSLEDVKAVIIPAAFNMTTGPAHWDITIRTRALDNQLYVMAASPARDTTASYVAFGNSRIADPWGSIIGSLDHIEGILIKEIDFSMLDNIREQLPLLKHRRTDLYNLELRQN